MPCDDTARRQHNRDHLRYPSDLTDAGATRKMPSWRLSNTMHADFCVEALNEALKRRGPPEIMNTDQGAQFTGAAWTTTLTEVGVRISMDGRGRCMDNIFIERLWRSLKQEAIYLTEIGAA